MNEIEYSARSIRDLRELLRYVAEQNPVVARQVSDAIRNAITRLAVNPALAISVGELRVGRYPLRKHKITIFVQHRPRKKVIRVLRITRGSRV